MTAFTIFWHTGIILKFKQKCVHTVARARKIRLHKQLVFNNFLVAAPKAKRCAVGLPERNQGQQAMANSQRHASVQQPDQPPYGQRQNPDCRQAARHPGSQGAKANR